jgi:4-amino-4-deoxy-L-arabinose transferase-like glycosyltransferase
MAEDWNPIKKPLISSSPHTQEWIRHYAKGPWYIALAVYKTTNHIEWAKCPTWLALAAMLFSVLAACLDFGMRRRRAIAIALLVSLNPVVTCQLCSYLVDGLLISFLACFTAALFIWFRCRNSLVLVLLITSAILCINSKFSGLVFLCFVSAGGGLYCLIKRRDLLIRYVLTQALIIVLGTAGFGYNPYVTNYIHRGHPFFPFMGTKEYPSLDQSGQNPIDKYETPHNMLRKNRLVCFGYAIFGRPGSQPFMDGQNARLMWPFIVPLKDIGMYYFHELRIAGFGPFFSGAFLFALILLAIALLVPNLPRTIIFLSTITIVASLLISRHAWWARYGPQLWWLPVVPVVAVFWRSHSLLLVRITWGLVALLLVNAFIVAAVHLNWEINSTKTLQQQIEKLRQSGEVEIDFQFFDVPFGRRLQTAGVSYRTVRFNGLPRGQELMSVCPGYPGAIKFRIPKDNQENIKNPD